MKPARFARRARGALQRRLAPLAAARRDGHGLLAPLRELLALRLGPTRLSSLEYHAMHLCDRQMHPNPEGALYGGLWFKEWVHAQLNNPRWEGMATDKLSMYALFRQLRLPHPEVLALATPQPRRHGDVPVLASREALVDFLRHSRDYPLFCKPVKGSKAAGSHRIERYDAARDELLLAGGERVSPLSFAAGLDDPTGFGVLFQRALSAAPETRPLCGPTIAGCRVIMLLDDDGAKPFKATWKIPVGSNFIDNYWAGRSGNLAGSLDLDSGRVQRVVRGIGRNLSECPRHPDTGAQLPGVQLPRWRETLALLRRAAESFPGFRWQHWDVGLSADGPVLFELNSAGAVDLTQLAEGTGIYDRELREFIARHGRRRPRGGLLFPGRGSDQRRGARGVEPPPLAQSHSVPPISLRGGDPQNTRPDSRPDSQPGTRAKSGSARRDAELAGELSGD